MTQEQFGRAPRTDQRAVFLCHPGRKPPSPIFYSKIRKSTSYALPRKDDEARWLADCQNCVTGGGDPEVRTVMNYGPLTAPAIGRLVKEMVRRAIVEIRKPASRVEHSTHLGRDGSPDFV